MAKKEAKALRIQEELVVHQLGFENTSANNQMVDQEVKKAEEKLKLETDARKKAIEAEIRSSEQQRQEKMKANQREIEKDMEAERARNKSHQCCFTPNSLPYQTVCDNFFRNLVEQEYISTCKLQCKRLLEN